MKRSLKKSNTLIIGDKVKWQELVEDIDTIPKVLLITSWLGDECDFLQTEALIKRGIELGCHYFLCAGDNSEALHDFIDNLILDFFNSEGDIITTWHDTDTSDELANFFVTTMNVSNSLLIAFFDNNSSKDDLLREAIVKTS